MVLIVILTISLLGTALFALFFNVLLTSRVELYRAQALYLAEAGLAKAVSTLKTRAGTGAGTGAVQVVFADTPQLQGIVPKTELGEGFFEAYSDLSGSILVSCGSSHGVTRTIQMKYSAF
jgi:hypothetical protein